MEAVLIICPKNELVQLTPTQTLKERTICKCDLQVGNVTDFAAVKKAR